MMENETNKNLALKKERTEKLLKNVDVFIEGLKKNNEDLRNLIKKWGMNQTLLAEKAEMSKQTFTNILNSNIVANGKPAVFKAKHLDNLYEALKEMRDDIDTYLKAYDNEMDNPK